MDNESKELPGRRIRTKNEARLIGLRWRIRQLERSNEGLKEALRQEKKEKIKFKKAAISCQIFIKRLAVKCVAAYEHSKTWHHRWEKMFDFGDWCLAKLNHLVHRQSKKLSFTNPPKDTDDGIEPLEIPPDLPDLPSDTTPNLPSDSPPTKD